LWCLDIYFAYIYIALFGSFLVDSHKEGVWALLLLPLKPVFGFWSAARLRKLSFGRFFSAA
jgi:hypothetical protein